ncbi:hypothetical protein WBP06_17785 [Novosphingobium sp. BL-8H]|uniref:hypothetical protein n=1 Tax=Novosphingobium sp. BL-8H TaxID=3127640 RepID=UPI0037573D68
MTGFGMDVIDWERGQRRLASAVRLWRSGDAAGPVLAALGRFADGAPIDECPALAALFGKDGSLAERLANGLVGGLVDAILPLLRENPLGQLPLRHAGRKTAHTLLLARERDASLAVTVHDGAALAARPIPHSAEFAPVETWMRVMAGAGTAACHLRDPARPGHVVRSELVLTPGTVLQRDGRREAMQVRAAQGALVVLRLQRRLEDADGICELAIEDGMPLRRAPARIEDSRLELAVSVLAAQGRRDAVPALGRIVSGSESAALRWSALRAVLALDTRAGLVLLGELADGDDPALAAAAQGVRRDLLVEWPELEKVAQWRG